MDIIGGDLTKQITSQVDLFWSKMQQNVIENKFNSEYTPQANIQPGMAIEFSVKGANNMYLDLNNSRLHVLAKIINADNTNIDANKTAPITLTLHSMFCEIGLELNGRNVATRASCTRIAYTWRLFSTFATTQQTRLLCEGWTKDTTGHMCVTAVDWNNAGLNGRAATIARSTVVELIGRPHLDVSNQKRLIPPNIDLHLKLMPNSSNLLCKSAAPGRAQQENYKLDILSVNLIILTKKLTSTAYGALMDLIILQNLRHHILRVQKHFSIPGNQTFINLDNVCTNALPDLVIVGLVSEADIAGG